MVFSGCIIEKVVAPGGAGYDLLVHEQILAAAATTASHFTLSNGKF